MKRILFLSVFLLLIAACTANTDQVRSVVLAYINAVAEVYSGKQSVENAQTMSGQQFELLKQQMNDFAARSVRIEPSLRSIKFVKVVIPATRKALVITDESWDIRYFSTITGREMRTVSYDLNRRYLLDKKGTHWMVVGSDLQADEDLIRTDPFVALPAELIPTGKAEEVGEQLKDSVLSYLTLLAEGYRKQDMTLLLHFATKRRAMKAYYHMSSMGEGQVRMVPKLLNIEIIEAESLDGNKGKVTTREQWEYSYFSTTTGKKIYENNIHYTLTYELVKDVENRWLVDNILIQEADQGEGEGKLPFFLRPHDFPADERPAQK